MNTPLDRIESRLQSLIEEWIIPFSRVDIQGNLAHHLIEAMRSQLTTASLEHPAAPNRYTIFLHPSNLEIWQSRQQLLSDLAEGLHQAAREAGLHLAGTPILQLASDPNLALDGIRVTAETEQPAVGQTAVLLLKKDDPPDKPALSAFLIYNGDQIFPLRQSVINIGRRSDNNLVIDDARISRAHAQIRQNRGQYVLFDLNSTGGTTVNGQRIRQYNLKPGDVIALAGVPLIYGEEQQAQDLTSETGQTQVLPKSGQSSEPEILE